MSASNSSDEVARLRAVYAARTSHGHLRARYGLSNRGNAINYEERQRVLAEIVTAHLGGSLRNVRILDVGCAWGGLLDELAGFDVSPDLFWGIDLMEDRIAEAARLYPGAHFVAGSAHDLPFRNSQFDVVYQGMLMSSILDAGTRAAVAGEMDRVLRPGGLVLWFDCRLNPVNLDARGVGRRELGALFPSYSIDARLIALAAPIARIVAPRSERLCRALGRIRGLRTHYLAALTKLG